MEIKIVTALSQADWDVLTDNNPHAFPEEGHQMQWQQSQWHIVAYDDHQLPIANIGFVGVNVQIEEQEYHINGIGGVVVKPEYRGQHLPMTLFEKLHQSELALSISQTFALFCPFRLESYYQQAGYQTLKAPVSFMQEEGMTTSEHFAFMQFGEALPAKPVKIFSLPW